MNLSIIVPIYNAEKYLNKCIESILKQSFSDFELILVNDGSKDRSLSICKYWENRDNRIHIIDKKNGGVSSARNAGIEISRGKYIGFIDSDDYIDQYMYEKLFKAVESASADIGICRRIIPGKEQNYGHNYPEGRGFRFSEDMGDWKSLFYQGDIETFVTNKLFRSTFIKQKSVKFQNYSLYEDRLYLTQLYLLDPLMIFVNEDLYFYRPVKGSSVHCYCPQKFEIIRKIYWYEIKMNSTFESGNYTNIINKEFAESVVNCIIQEKELKKTRQIVKFDEIRKSKEFYMIYSEMNVLGLSYKKERWLRLLYQRKYNILHYQLRAIEMYDTIRKIVKNLLEKKDE